jgi:membrane protein implicated in regulation of membrane protease activity
MKKAIAIVLSVFAAIFAILAGKRLSKPKKEKPEPPENKAADVAEGAVQESFEEQVDRIKSATTGDSPADDLADLGNARRR